MLGVHPETKEKRKRGEERVKEERGGARWKNGVHPTTSARVCSSHATMPCCCVKSGGGWLSCASMSMSMRGNVMHGTSCHHHHHDELFVCQCVLQPAIPACMCVCVCRGHASAGSSRKAHTPQKRESACVCEEEERETAGQMNQPSEVKQRACVCVKKK